MSEKDLELKVNSRRLLWRMGFSTRVDVPLRAVMPPSTTRRSNRYESFTDLDVLGIAIAPGFAIRKVIADCKTSAKGSTERMFWIRGVADFFNADDAWMVRSNSVTQASRQLSSRLSISVLEPADLEALETYHPSGLELSDGPLRILFDQSAVAASMHAFTQIDKKLAKLVEFRQFDFWMLDSHRNLQQVVAHLSAAADVLDPTHPTHRALFYDCAWLYVLTLAQVSAHVRAVHVTDVDTSLRSYFFGGELALKEKQQLAALLRKRFAAKGGSPDDGVLPHWYPQLLELLTRHLRRPYVFGAELRYAEWIAAAQIAKDSTPASEAFAPDFSLMAAKLLADVCGFLVTSAHLNANFRVHARLVLAQPLPHGTSEVPSTTEEASSPPGGTPTAPAQGKPVAGGASANPLPLLIESPAPDGQA